MWRFSNGTIFSRLEHHDCSSPSETRPACWTESHIMHFILSKCEIDTSSLVVTVIFDSTIVLTYCYWGICVFAILQRLINISSENHHPISSKNKTRCAFCYQSIDRSSGVTESNWFLAHNTSITPISHDTMITSFKEHKEASLCSLKSSDQSGSGQRTFEVVQECFCCLEYILWTCGCEVGPLWVGIASHGCHQVWGS